ncbi:MAG: GtrA family protein, partial [Proteobacteria bacterium]|nr:GtrA family protein [Pseudomonadota bacterium]
MMLDRRFAAFCAVGFLNTAFGYSLFAVFVFAGVHRALALFLATCAGVLFNFYSTGRLVFGNRELSRLPKFIATYGAVYLINLALMELLISAGTGVYVG